MSGPLRNYFGPSENISPYSLPPHIWIKGQHAHNNIYCHVHLLGWAFRIIIEAFLLCRPFAANWDITIPGHCGNRNAAFVAAGALNMFTDILVLVLPIPYIWGLRLATSRKIGLTGIFSLGLL
jgi:hypothetical protein